MGIGIHGCWVPDSRPHTGNPYTGPKYNVGDKLTIDGKDCVAVASEMSCIGCVCNIPGPNRDGSGGCKLEHDCISAKGDFIIFKELTKGDPDDN